jgi:hypothetical protein
MRLFQNSALYPAYRVRLRQLTAGCRTFTEVRQVCLADRFGAPHLLQPVLEGEPDAFFTNGDDEPMQRLWAREQGMAASQGLEEILLAQVEHHRTEVFYNLDPMRFGSSFVKRLPGCVKQAIAWRAAPSPGADFSAYDWVVCNFPSILASYAQQGWRPAYFAPAHDPVMDGYAQQGERPIDILFVGGYTRHHRRRAALLEAVAALDGTFRVAMHLDRSRLNRLAESPLGRLLPLSEHRRPRTIQRVTRPPLFGLDLYQALGQAKVVLNGAIDMAGEDRGNMRCFEAMGCGAMLLSDKGRYPEGMQDGSTLVTYDGPNDAVARLRHLLASPGELAGVASAGHRMVSEVYSKSRQWEAFVKLASGDVRNPVAAS